MSEVLSAVTAAYTLGAVTLAILGAVAWWRSRRGRTLVLALAFVAFALAGGVASVLLFRTDDAASILLPHMTLSGIGLLLVYLAAVKR